MKAVLYFAALFLTLPAGAHDRESIMTSAKQTLIAKASKGTCFVSIEDKSLPALEGTYDILISPLTPFGPWDGKCDFKNMTVKLFKQVPGNKTPGYGNKVSSSSIFVDLGSDGEVDAYAPGEVGPKKEPHGLYLAILQELFKAKK